MSKSTLPQGLLAILWGGVSASGFDRFWRARSKAQILLGSFAIVVALSLPALCVNSYLRRVMKVFSFSEGHLPQPSWAEAIFLSISTILVPYVLWLSLLYAVHWFGIGQAMRHRPEARRLLSCAASVFPLQYLLIWVLMWFAVPGVILLDAYGVMPPGRSHPRYGTVYYGLAYGIPLAGWALAFPLTYMGIRNNVRHIKSMLANT